MTEKLANIFSRYEESHKNPRNILIHKFCVPLIHLSTLGLLASIPGPVNFMYLVLAGAFVYYAMFRSFKLMALALVENAVMVYLVDLMGEQRLLFSAVIFAIAWVVQLVGHKIEGKKPSLMEDLQFLLVGPIWIFKPLF